MIISTGIDLDALAKELRDKIPDKVVVGGEVFEALRKDSIQNPPPAESKPAHNISIVVNRYLPDRIVALVDRDGNLIGVMKL